MDESEKFEQGGFWLAFIW